MKPVTKPWADGPFELCKLIPDTDDEACKPFVEAANHMGVVHLAMVRWLNTIYNQAPNIPKSDIPNFVAYALSWCFVMEVHHRGEETGMFPELEAACHLPGFLSHSIEQHHAFHDPFEMFRGYLTELRTNPELYSGAEIQKRIEAFAPILTQHLSDELVDLASIPAALPEGVKPQDINIAKMIDEAGVHSMSQMSLGTDTTYFMMNHDLTYDHDRFKEFPPAPFVVKFLYTYVTPFWSRATNKFASCDSYGQPRELLYA